MRALDQEVKDAVWAAVRARLPVREDSHPLGCHRRRAPDRLCFEGILTRLATGCSWQTAERLLGCGVSDTTLRARRDEWIEAGVFDAVAEPALGAYDRIVGFDLTEVADDGSAHKAPCGGPGTGSNPTERGKSGWKWSLCVTAPPSRWVGAPTAPTATTRFCSPPPSTRQPTAACSPTSRPCTSTAAMTALRSGPAPPTGASTTSSAPADDHAAPPNTKPPPHSGCDGPSNAPTRGCRTSDNSAATPTGIPNTDSPNSPSPSSCSSPPNSSTGATAGTHPAALSANALTVHWKSPYKPGNPQVFRPEHLPILSEGGLAFDCSLTTEQRTVNLA